MIDVKLIKKPKGGSAGSGGTRYVSGTADESRHALKADESLRSDRADFADRAEYSDRSGHASRSSYSDVAEDLVEDSPVFGKFLSRLVNDAAQGVITFVKGVLFGDGSHGITEDGDASLRDIRMQSTQSEGYSGTDIITDKGFKVWEDSDGKSHLITDYFTARVKAFFASLEIRKIEHSAGNRIESPAGNTLALVKKFNAADEEIKDKWHARRYGFGLSWGYKLVHAAGRFFGVWKEDETAEVAYYRCYWTADDKEAKKAVTNNWKVGDQAFCETFNLRTQDKNGNTMRGYASNKRYWRLVVGTGYETIEGTDYAYIDLSNVAEYVTVVDEQGQERVCRYGYESGTVDKPEAGDDVACFGNQITPSTRGSAIQYITYDPNAEHSGDGVPCVKMYSGIDSFESLDSFVIQKHSPTGVFVRADKFKIYSAAGTGMSADDPSSTLICDRGDYSSTSDYAYGDLVQYHGSSWLCIALTPIRGEAPSDGSSYWKIYARRGMGAPQIVLDSTNAIVSANSDGKIASISAATGLPTKIELYVDGNKIPVSAWDTGSSYVKYYDRTCHIDQLLVLGYGIVLTRITKNPNDISLAWQYRAEEVMSVGDFTRVVHPVINATDISVHIVFTYNGETYTADASMPMIVQRAGAPGAPGAPGADGADGADGTNGHDVMAEYSVDGSANSWHPVFQNGDVYVHYSYDGGTTWTQAIRFVGKSVEFERGIMHFASYGTMESLLSMTLIGANYVGYYLCDQASDGITAQATLWYWNGRDTLTPVTIQNEVNYLASDYDNNENGHLWNADSNSTSWSDMGVIQGADGVDGISITLDPSSAIFNQAETSPYGIDTSGFSATVRVWQGTTPLSGSFIPQNGVRGTNCQAHFVGNVVYIDSIGYTLDADNQKHYYSSGKVAVDVRINNQTTTLTLNWAANLLGEWKLKVESDTMESVSNMDVAYYDENGSLTSERLSTAIKQNSRGVYLSAKKDDVESAGIHLDGQNSSIDLIAGKVNFIDPNGGVNTKISIDTTTGTLHAVDGEFEGKITAKNYLTLYADLGTYCYCKNPIEHPEILTEEKLFIPGFHKTMYDVNGNALNIESYWCFILSQGMVVMLPDALPSGESLVGQRIVLYDPTFGGYSNTTYVIIVAGSIELDEDDEDTYNTTIGDVIRGVGIKINSTSPVPVDRWDPVRKIMFTDGITELQCVPSDSNDFDWCVVNIGTNVYHLYENV